MSAPDQPGLVPTRLHRPVVARLRWRIALGAFNSCVLHGILACAPTLAAPLIQANNLHTEPAPTEKPLPSREDPDKSRVSQATPRAALRTFIHAFRSQRYDVLLRLVPNATRRTLTADALKNALQGAQGEQVKAIIENLARALPTAPVERQGWTARIPYGRAHVAILVDENGLWKIEELQ